MPPKPPPAANPRPAKHTTNTTSAGGVQLPPPTAAPIPSPAPQKDVTKPRRKPRKLSRTPASTTPAAVIAQPPKPDQPDLRLNNEITALKSRMRDLESQVSALHHTLPAAAASPPAPKPPRRRGRGHPLPGTESQLQTLNAELAAAHSSLAELRLQRAAAKTHANDRDAGGVAIPEEDEEEVIEEVRRQSGPSVETTPTTAAGEKAKSVTLTGRYRIPLPANVSLEDVRTLQSGLSSANKIARGIVGAARVESGVGGGVSGEAGSWSEWIGGYSLSVARFVNTVEAQAAVEQGEMLQRPGVQRPGVGRRRTSAPGAGAGGRDVRRPELRTGGSRASEGAAGPGCPMLDAEKGFEELAM